MFDFFFILCNEYQKTIYCVRSAHIRVIYGGLYKICGVGTDAGRVPRAAQVLPRLQGHAAARQREGARRQRRARPRCYQCRRSAAQAPQLHAGSHHAAPPGETILYTLSSR